MATAGRWDLVHRAATMALQAQRRVASPVDAPTLPEIEPGIAPGDPDWEREPWEEPEHSPAPAPPEEDPFNPEFPEEWDLPTPKLRPRGLHRD